MKKPSTTPPNSEATTGGVASAEPDPQRDRRERIRFKTNTIIPSDAPGGSSFLPAGEPSPFYDISEVPENLRAVVGTPPTGNVDAEAFDAETELIRDDGLDPGVKAALEELDQEVVERMQVLSRPIPAG